MTYFISKEPISYLFNMEFKHITHYHKYNQSYCFCEKILPLLNSKQKYDFATSSNFYLDKIDLVLRFSASNYFESKLGDTFEDTNKIVIRIISQDFIYLWKIRENAWNMINAADLLNNPIAYLEGWQVLS